MKKLKIHPNGRYLMWDTGEPFFYLGDTAWELFHKLSKGEIDHYISMRSKQGFNAIQAVLLAEKDGLRKPNAYGRYPLCEENGIYNPTKPDLGNGYDYWQHVDYAVKKAAEYGMFMVLLPTWGDKYFMNNGDGPEIFTAENAYVYANWLAKRYRDEWSIIWMLGGDRPLRNDLHRAVIDAMGNGLRDGDSNHLITFHPNGGNKSITYVPRKDYIDFHTIQSGHEMECYSSWEMLRKTGAEENKPFMDSEPRYEDHPACFKPEYGYFWNCDDVRQNAYWNLMEGACGHTYGSHPVWVMNTVANDYFPYSWQESLEHEGANQFANILKLRNSRPFFEFRNASELIVDDTAINAHQSAGRGENYAFVYSPLGMPIRIFLEQFEGTKIRASWFNPRTGDIQVFALVPAQESLFVPPTSGHGCDWVLVVDVVD